MKPALLCYDGSDHAKRAIEQAAAVLGGGPALVLCVWESVGSLLLRHPVPGEGVGRDLRETSEDVVGALDEKAGKAAEATAAEGAELAGAAGFEARPLARRALARATERDPVTVWRAVLDAADEEDAGVLVLGSRGRSGVRSALLGSVSYGVAHNSTRPLLIVPPEHGE